MSQVLVLLLYVFWIVALPARGATLTVNPSRLAWFCAGFALIVLVPAVIIRYRVSRLGAVNAWQLHLRTLRLIAVCRVAIVVWFVAGLFYGATWVEFVQGLLGGAGKVPITLPGMLLGPLPALAAWVGLWWAQYPVDRLAREQSIGPLLAESMPAHPPPTLAGHIESGLRLQILATAVPLLLISFIRDAINLVLWTTSIADPRAAGIEATVTVAAALMVLAIAPEPLRRIFRTSRLPASALRARLDELCRAAGTRYREVLLWNTNYAMGNAAVMGLLPQIRYVMLSDLLLETMSDSEIEAVFAHELGHIVHRHTIWYVVFVVSVVVASTAVEAAVALIMHEMQLTAWASQAMDYTFAGAIVALLILLFGMFSRRLERQADVYAARAMQPTSGQHEPRLRPVSPAGAAAVASALYRAASINHIPVEARSFRHGSIAKRVRFLQDLSAHPERSTGFDRGMRFVYTLVLGSLLCGAGALVAMYLYSRNAM